MLSIENASFGYNNQDLLFEDIDIKIKKNECFCLLGPNGCGKTTLFNCINGTFKLKSGDIFLNGKNIEDYSLIDLACTMGIVFQEHKAPFPYTCLEVVRMGRTPHLGILGKPSEEDTHLARSIMEKMGILKLENKRYTYISGGEKQLVLIARTLCQQPDIILLDEPTSHLDFKNQAMILATLRDLSDKGMTILMTSHFPNHVWKIGTHAAMMGYEGLVAQGKVDEVMTEQNLSQTYGIEVNIFKANNGDKKTIFCDPCL